MRVFIVKANVLFITAIYNLFVKDDLGQGFEITPGLFVTSDIDYIRRLTQPDYLSPIIGSLEMNILLSGRPVIYRIAQLGKEEDPQEKLKEFLYEVQAFIQCFWFHMDCSVNNELAFSIHWTSEGARIDSNSIATNFTNTQGEVIDISLDKVKLKQISLNYYNNFRPLTQWLGQYRTQMTTETHRAERALYHITRARTQSDLGLRIADYCSAFEAFFSTSIEELSHQLAERIAVLLASDSAMRISLYKSVKAIYGIRSKVVHGALLKKRELNHLHIMSTECDKIARNMFKTFFDRQSLRTAMSAVDSLVLDNYYICKILEESNS